MKYFTLSFFFLFCSLTTTWGAYGIFEAGLTVNGTTYGETFNTFQGKNFSVAQGGTLDFTYAFAKTFKNGGSDVCGARIHYAVYPAAGAPSFLVNNLCFDFNIGGGGDQQWSSVGACAFAPINLASGLLAGAYKIAVYYSAPGGNCGTPVDVFLSNSGANYIADLTVDLPLAVNLTAFDAHRMPSGVELTWQTAAERDQVSYEVERSATTGAWLPIGSVIAHGTATQSASYSFTDENPLAGDNYYRLAMKDLSGKTTYSSVVRLIGKSAAWQIAPNPATDALVLRFLEKDAPEATSVRLYNAQGALALEYYITDSSPSIRVSLTGLPVGTYWLEIQLGDGARTALQTIIKQ